MAASTTRSPGRCPGARRRLTPTHCRKTSHSTSGATASIPTGTTLPPPRAKGRARGRKPPRLRESPCPIPCRLRKISAAPPSRAPRCRITRFRMARSRNSPSPRSGTSARKKSRFSSLSVSSSRTCPHRAQEILGSLRPRQNPTRHELLPPEGRPRVRHSSRWRTPQLSRHPRRPRA